MAEVFASSPVESLIVDLLAWVDGHERSYDEVLSVWRTSCPRLPVWEDANDAGLLAREYKGGRLVVRLSERGRAMLRERERH